MPTKRIYQNLVLAVLVAGSVANASGSPENRRTVPMRDAGVVHCNVLTIDSHIDVPRNFATPEVDPGLDGPEQLTLPKMRRGCLDAAFFVAAVGQKGRSTAEYQQAWDDALAMIAGVIRMVEQYPQQIALARTADDVVRFSASGRLSALIGLENGYPLGEELGRVKKLFDLGVRYITLTHIGHNAIGDSSVPIRELGDPSAEHGGLSEFGRKVIREMNCVGILVDISHTSHATTIQSIDASQAPVIASHSGARALVDTPRNLDDEAIRRLAARGGVVQVAGYSAYVKPNAPQKERAIADIARQMGLDGPFAWGEATNSKLVAYGNRLAQLDDRWPRASVSDFVDHIDHIVKLVGVDHVGVGSDFYAGGGAASGGLAGWMDVSEGAHITAELLRRGYDEQTVSKIWGGNLLRVMREAEAVARNCRHDRS